MCDGHALNHLEEEIDRLEDEIEHHVRTIETLRKNIATCGSNYSAEVSKRQGLEVQVQHLRDKNEEMIDILRTIELDRAATMDTMCRIRALLLAEEQPVE